MISRLVAYYDKKLGVYSQPMNMPDVSNEDIIEQTRRMCANPQVKEEFFDYDLYDLGTYDDKMGQVIALAKPDFIVSLGDFRYLRGEKDVKN